MWTHELLLVPSRILVLSLRACGLLTAMTLFASGSVPAFACDAAPTIQRTVGMVRDAELTGWHGVPHIDPREIANLPEKQRQAQMAAWTAEAKQHWRLEGEVLVSDGTGPYLATNEHFEDFELSLSYRIEPGADSGIYLRGSPQIQIWDPENRAQAKFGAAKGSGGLWNNSPGAAGKDPLVRADRPAGDWNDLRVIMVGPYVSVWLNDQLVVDHAPMENYFDRDAPIFRSGPIILQTHGGETRWRDIQIRRIGPVVANELLRCGGPAREADAADSGFTSLFNGRDFTGWCGATRANRVEDGAILSESGTIYTEAQYGDFVVRLEFLIPEGGNNGLAIRYPGDGDPAYVGMCELQILDNLSYADLVSPRQMHGSAYGMVAARRGYLRSAGTWNYQQVTVVGSTIQVELNGYPILDTNLSNVDDPTVALAQFAGRLRKRGHFGLAGHGVPVKFRNLEIKRLDGEDELENENP